MLEEARSQKPEEDEVDREAFETKASQQTDAEEEEDNEVEARDQKPEEARSQKKKKKTMKSTQNQNEAEKGEPITFCDIWLITI